MVRDEEACHGEHVAVRAPLVSEFSASSVWVPGAKLRSSDLAASVFTP